MTQSQRYSEVHQCVLLGHRTIGLGKFIVATTHQHVIYMPGHVSQPTLSFQASCYLRRAVTLDLCKSLSQLPGACSISKEQVGYNRHHINIIAKIWVEFYHEGCPPYLRIYRNFYKSKSIQNPSIPTLRRQPSNMRYAVRDTPITFMPIYLYTADENLFNSNTFMSPKNNMI